MKMKGAARDVLGQLLETGKSVGKQAKQQLSPAKFLDKAVGQLRGTEKLGGSPTPAPPKPAAMPKKPSLAELSPEEFEAEKRKRALAAMQRYRQIQQALRQLYLKKQQEVPAYIKGKPGFDEERLAAGEKPAKEELPPLQEPTTKRKSHLPPWLTPRAKKGMGTGEFRRGVSG